MKFRDFHVHSNFCDGKDDIESIVKEAIKKEMTMLGFSGHSYVTFDDCCMSLEKQKEYCSTIAEMKQKYQDQIKVFCGIELDYFSPVDTSSFEYVIGSAHYCKVKDGYVAVDYDLPTFIRTAETYFNGNYMDFAEAYYENVANVKQKTNCDIVGHFDLFTKFNEGNALFDEHSPRYRDMAIAALDKLIAEDALFEVNTGAMSRKYRTSPYPSEFLLKRILEKKGSIILSSDAHAKENLCYKFPEMIDYLKGIGFSVEKLGEGFTLR